MNAQRARQPSTGTRAPNRSSGGLLPVTWDPVRIRHAPRTLSATLHLYTGAFMPLPRRSILTGGAAGVGLVVAGSVPSLAEARAERHRAAPAGQRPFPPLVDDPDGILALPPGFSYKIVTYAGKTQLQHGEGPTPSNHDGTAVFEAGRGRLRLIQNHELPAGSKLGVPHIPGTVYDPTALMAGGCTVIGTGRPGGNHRGWGGVSRPPPHSGSGPTPRGAAAP